MVKPFFIGKMSQVNAKTEIVNMRRENT